MPPIHNGKRGASPAETSIPEPSTWKVLMTVGSTGFLIYHIWNQATRVWHYLQRKIYMHNREKAVAAAAASSTPQQNLRKRAIKLEKRGSPPFSIFVNICGWFTRIVGWVYHQTDQIPQRIQQRVDREYQEIQEAKWEVKMEQAEDRVKDIMAKEFPDYFQRKYLAPYEPGSDLYDQHKQLLQSHHHHPPRKRHIIWEQAQEMTVW